MSLSILLAAVKLFPDLSYAILIAIIIYLEGCSDLNVALGVIIPGRCRLLIRLAIGRWMIPVLPVKFKNYSTRV